MASVTGGARRVTADRDSTDPVLPATTDEVRGVIADACATAEPIQLQGSGTWSDAGPPRCATRTLSMRALSGIISYVPGDLTITAWAGTTLAELSHATAAHGQWLGLDPAGDRLGTIGATVSTASAGPLAHAFGTPRDLVLGIEAVTGYGDVIRPGGRVVKNVAGFDLVRLFTGAWGTLGAITAVTLRLRALPVHDVTLALPIRSEATLDALIPRLRANTLSLLALEWLDGATAQSFGVGRGDDTLLVRIGGNDAFVRGQHSALSGVASVESCDPSVWASLSNLDAGAVVVARVSGAVSTLSARLAAVRAALGESDVQLVMHASVQRGIIRVIASRATSALRAVLGGQSTDQQCVVERQPAAWWSTTRDPFRSPLGTRIRAAFDPREICNRTEVRDA